MTFDFRILPCGDSSVAVTFGEEPNIAVNTMVRSFNLLLGEKKVEGITETIPTYCSLMIHYDPLKLKYGKLRAVLGEMKEQLQQMDSLKVSDEVIRIPVLYAPPGSEIEMVAAYEGKTAEEIIKIHTESEHYVFMVGFSPGGSYIGCPEGSFTIPRKKVPTMRPYSGSVGVQTDQSNVSAFPGPSGWYSIGRTPVRPFDIRLPCPALFLPGQWVQFYPIDADLFATIEASVQAGTYRPEIVRRAPEKSRRP